MVTRCHLNLVCGGCHDICVLWLLPPYPPPIFPTSSRLSHDSLSRPNLAEIEKKQWQQWEAPVMRMAVSVASLLAWRKYLDASLFARLNPRAKRGFLRWIDWDYFARLEARRTSVCPEYGEWVCYNETCLLWDGVCIAVIVGVRKV